MMRAAEHVLHVACSQEAAASVNESKQCIDLLSSQAESRKATTSSSSAEVLDQEQMQLQSQLKLAKARCVQSHLSAAAVSLSRLVKRLTSHTLTCPICACAFCCMCNSVACITLTGVLQRPSEIVFAVQHIMRCATVHMQPRADSSLWQAA